MPSTFPLAVLKGHGLRLLMLILAVAWQPLTSRANTPPPLNISTSGANLQISWPTSATDWMLCCSDSLAAVEWKLVSTVPTVSGGQNVVTVPLATSSPFYELRHRGAIVPFTTYEAEAATVTGGTVVQLTTPPTSTTWSPELEASGRAYVQLNNTGDRIDFANVIAANTLVIRHCIPDAPTGGGITGTLSLYVNGVFRQKLTLSSTYNWLYGDGTVGSNGQSNDPTITGATPHVFWDETRAFITGGLQAGDTLRLQKDADDTAAYYRVDLVDLENVAAPLSPPPAGTYLSVTDYGANGNDTNDDTTAIQNCINAAQAQGKIVWFPAGTYYQTANFTLNGVRVQGAGMWYTSLISTVTGTTFAGKVGFTLTGTNPRVSDMFIASTAYTNRSSPGGIPFTLTNPCTGWSVENVWITHTTVGFWMSGGTNGVVRGCRVRLTYADGININNNTSYAAANTLVEMNHVRGCGDDGIAILCGNPSSQISTNNTIHFNTVIANWWGQNCDIAGGTGHLIEDNLFADNSQLSCFTINLPPSYPMYSLTNSTIRRNTILRGGGNGYGQKRGAMWIFPGGPSGTTISGVNINDNEVRDSIFRGIQLAGTYSQAITFNRNVVDHPGENGFNINFGVIGSGAFNNNVSRNINSGFSAFSNSATSPGYTVTLNGNNW